MIRMSDSRGVPNLRRAATLVVACALGLLPVACGSSAAPDGAPVSDRAHPDGRPRVTDNRLAQMRLSKPPVLTNPRCARPVRAPLAFEFGDAAVSELPYSPALIAHERRLGSRSGRERYGAVIEAGQQLMESKDGAMLVELLHAALRDPSFGARHQAAVALLHTGRRICSTEMPTGVFEEFAGLAWGETDKTIAWARDRAGSCRDDPAAGEAAWILGVLGDARDIPALRVQTQPGSNEYARLHAADALRHLGDVATARATYRTLAAEGARFYARVAAARLELVANEPEPACDAGHRDGKLARR
jgi:HEAT repeat protein